MGLTVEKCLQAWTNSLRQMNAKADMVFFGDSLTYYGDFASVFPDKVVYNLGLRGDTIQGMINRVEQVKMLEPKQVFLMTGINDIAHVTADDFEILYNRLIDVISQGLPDATIVVQTMLPVNNHNFSINCNNAQIVDCNGRIKKIVEKRKLYCLDLHALYVEDGLLPMSLTRDGLHLTSKAYLRWNMELKKCSILN